MNVFKQRELANIYISEVPITQDSLEVDQLWAIHCQQKVLFNELLEADADSEEILEALEVFIGTNNMDGYLLDIEPQLNNFLVVNGLES